MARRFLVLQHAALEDPGFLLINAARKHRLVLDVVPVWKRCIPDLAQYAGLIVLGGKSHIQRNPKCTSFTAEQSLVHEWVRQGLPYLGFGIGLELLAHCLGATTTSSQLSPAVGFATGYLTAAGREHPAFCRQVKHFPIFKWHGQAILPPAPRSLDILATSAQCEIEAVSLAGNPQILAVHYDNCFADPQDVARLLDQDRQRLAERFGQPIDHQLIFDQACMYQKQIRAHFNSFFANYLRLL